jgi:hypothetical protein
MAATAPQPNGIPSSRQPAVDRYAAVVRRVVGDRALALALVGPGLADARSRHHLDSVLVLAQDDLALLRELGRAGKGLSRDLIAPPLVLTAEAIQRSRDTFPLELLEMAETQVPVFGGDPFAGVVLAPEHVRLQCERELKSVAVAIRQRVLVAAGDTASLRPHELADTVVRVLRGLLCLKKAAPARHGSEVIDSAERALGRTLPAVRGAWSGSVGWDAYAALYAEIAALGALVDGW